MLDAKFTGITKMTAVQVIDMNQERCVPLSMSMLWASTKKYMYIYICVYLYTYSYIYFIKNFH